MRADQPEPIGVHRHARSFLQAGRFLAPSLATGHFAPRFDDPIRHLHGHAIETVLKAHLRTCRFSEEQLRKAPFGHDLETLDQTAIRSGLGLGRRGWSRRRAMIATPDAIDDLAAQLFAAIGPCVARKAGLQRNPHAPR